jgi:sterol 14-demethylase
VRAWCSTPIPERRAEMLHNTALRGEQMKGHAATIENEVKQDDRRTGATTGEIELLDFFSELTIYTSTACLIGLKFREQLDSRFARTTTTSSSAEPTRSATSTPTWTSRASASATSHASNLSRWCRRSWTGAESPTHPRANQDRDLLDVLVSIKDEDGAILRFTANEVTGMFISLMFAGTTPVRAPRPGR